MDGLDLLTQIFESLHGAERQFNGTPLGAICSVCGVIAGALKVFGPSIRRKFSNPKSSLFNYEAGFFSQYDTAQEERRRRKDCESQRDSELSRWTSEKASLTMQITKLSDENSSLKTYIAKLEGLCKKAGLQYG